MIKLVFYELSKLWCKRSFLFGVMSLVVINFLLLFINGQITLNKNSAAYKKMTSELSGLSMEEKKIFVDEMFRRIDGIYTIDQLMRIEANGISEYSRAVRKENSAIIKEFQRVYQIDNYVHYTNNLQEEYQFISQIKKELDTVYDYDSYLGNIRKKADSLSQISIFKTKSGDSFSEKSIRAQAEAYETMEKIQTNYFPEIGIMSALEFRLSDVLLIAFVLLMSSVLLREEKDSGMLNLNYSLPGGHGNTAFAKLGAVAVSLIGMICSLYYMNLLYYNSVYGLGNLNRAVQSLPSLIQCPWKLSVGEYIQVFLVAKWMSAVIVGVWLMLCTYIAANIYAGWGAGLIFIGLNYLVRVSVSGIGHFNLFRYMNIFSFMNTNEVLGTYIQLYFFGNPLPILWSECVGGLVVLVLFSTVFVRKFQCGTVIYANRPIRVFRFTTGIRHRCHKKTVGLTSRLIKHELYKVLKINGGILIFGAYVLLLIVTSIGESDYISLKEKLYKDYMVQWGGRITKDTIEMVNNENENFTPLYELEDAMVLGILTQEQYSKAKEAYSGLESKKEIFDQIINIKFSYIEAHPKAWLVYDTGYNKLFDMYHTQDIYEMMLLFVVLIFGFGSLYSLEKMTGMSSILTAIPLGPRRLASVKFGIGYSFGAILAIFSLLPRYINVGITYGFSQLLAPAQSLEAFSGAPPWICIYHIVVVQFLFRVFAAFAAVGIISWLSCKTKNTLSVFFASVIVLELCPMLYVCGVSSLLWLSLWPLFHFPAVLDYSVPVFLLILYGILFLGIAIKTKDNVMNTFCIPYKFR